MAQNGNAKQSWMAFVPTRSLDRGCDYYSAGLVYGLAASEGRWRASVEGNRTYSVSVPSSMDPRLATCTCPHYADGNICKHIAAVMVAIEARTATDTAAESASGLAEELPPSKRESIEQIINRLNIEQIRTFLIEEASRSEALERRLRGAFGTADIWQAKRDLQKATTSLMREYERGGFIDWHRAIDFEADYAGAIDSIVRPLLSAGSADDLRELAIARLVQLQRICIDDSNGFFTDTMASIIEHFDLAFERSDTEQRACLFEALHSFITNNPGKDRGDVYWFEKDEIEEFVMDRFAEDAQIAPSVLALADERLAELEPPSGTGFDYHRIERQRWALARLQTMRMTGSSADALHAYAEQAALLETSDALCLLADVYVENGQPRKAAELLLEHPDAQAAFRSSARNHSPVRAVDRLIAIASDEYDEQELAQLYFSLLIAPPRRDIGNVDLTSWYDMLHTISGKTWKSTRANLLSKAPASTVHTCLAHEGSLDELFDSIMADGGKDLPRFESILADAYPEPYIERYLDNARFLMETARGRTEYRRLANELAHAARLQGGNERACELAEQFHHDNPRRTALRDELRKAGFLNA